MKASELRLNNYVLEDGQVVLLSTNYDLFKCLVNVDRGIGFEPIPLTEEWLLKFGFVKSKVSSQFDKEKLTIQIANELEYHKKGRVYFNSWAILEESIKYVHQLQNLYFALTGKEITFKSE
jgi:hypothetical protein